MIFFIDIDVSDLPTTQLSFSSSKMDSQKMPFNEKEIVFATDLSRMGRGAVITRNACYYGKYVDCNGKVDICTLEFDDFVPGMTLEDNPPWHTILKDRIVEVRAEERYGSGQGIRVTECAIWGRASAIVRHLQAGELVYFLKIAATGPEALNDARELHQKLLKEGQRKIMP